MQINYDFVPCVEDGLNLLSRQILKQLCKENGQWVQGETLVADLAWQNRMLPYDYEEVLPSLAQKFVLNLPILSGEGPLGDWALQCAGTFYKVRLNELGMQLASALSELPKIPVPILPVNGSMVWERDTTAIPPHNPADISAALCALLKNPELDDQSVLDLVVGPDFPGGGIVRLDDELKRFYTTGEGRLTLFPQIYETEHNERTALLISELPYLMDSHEACAKIKHHVKNIAGICDFCDCSNGDGIKILVILKKAANKETVAEQLRMVLQRTYPLRCTVLRDGKLETLSFKNLLREFLKVCSHQDFSQPVHDGLVEFGCRFGYPRRTIVERV